MFGLFRKNRDAVVDRIYDQILVQARQPSLFLDHAVPDTVEGRYDMMVLHAFLAVHRLGRAGDAGRDLSQAACNKFFAEMDLALREMGVGDLAVPKRMKTIAELYSGCSAAYAAALGCADDAALVAALARNVYDDPTGTDARAGPLAAYVRTAANSLAQAPDEMVLAGSLPFPSAGDSGRHAA